mgnify:CR=1 FL=1
MGTLLAKKEVEVLEGLGLTSCQAKAYLALCHFGLLDAKTVTKYADVPRSDTYRIMSELEGLGLIEKVISRPTTFRAISLEMGTSILLKRKKEETDRLESNIKGLLENFKTNNKQLQLPKPEFVLIPGKEAIINRSKIVHTNTQISIDSIVSLKRFRPMVFSYLNEAKKLLERGVEFRVILEKPEDKKSIPEIKELKKYPSYELRYVLNSPSAQVTIFDKKEAFITTLAKAGLAESSTLWSNNPSLLSIIQEYFEMVWIKAMKNQHDDLIKMRTR